MAQRRAPIGAPAPHGITQQGAAALRMYGSSVPALGLLPGAFLLVALPALH